MNDSQSFFDAGSLDEFLDSTCGVLHHLLHRSILGLDGTNLIAEIAARGGMMSRHRAFGPRAVIGFVS